MARLQTRPFIVSLLLLVLIGGLSLIPNYGFWLAGISLVILTGILSLLYPRWLILPIALGLIAGQLARVGVSSDSSGGLLLIDVATAAYGGIGLVRLFMTKKRLTVSLPALLMGIFGLWAGATLVLGLPILARSDAIQAAFYLVRFGIIFLAFAMTPLLFDTEAKHQKLTTVILASATLLMLLGFAQLIIFPNFAFMAKFGWDPHDGRLLSTFFDPNFFGMFLVFLITLFVARILTTKTSWIIWTITALSLIALVLTYSRSSYLALAVSLGIVLLIRSWKIMLISLTIVAIAALQIPRVRDRVVGAFQVDTTAQDRITSWKEAETIINDHLITGVGFNAYGPADVRYGFKANLLGRSANGSDSSILFVTATTGIVGFVLYALFLFSLCWQAITVYKHTHSDYLRALALAYIGIWPAIMIHSQFVNSLFYPLVIVPILLVAAGLGLGFDRYTRPSDPDTIKE